MGNKLSFKRKVFKNSNFRAQIKMKIFKEHNLALYLPFKIEVQIYCGHFFIILISVTVFPLISIWS